MELSRHLEDMLLERRIPREWVTITISSPERTEERGDGTRHYLRQFPENGNRWLRVVVNVERDPNRAVTVFFDRRVRGAS